MSFDEQKLTVLNHTFEGWGTFEIACAASMTKLAFCILNKSDGGVQIPPHRLGFALMWCCRNGLIEVAHKILEMPYTIIEYGEEGRYFKKNKTPLIYACESKMTSVVRILLTHSSSTNIGQVDEDGQTALLVAIKNGLSLASMMILKCPEIDVNHRGADSMTALMWACNNRLVGTCMALLDVEGIDLSLASAADNSTPLILACIPALEMVALKIIGILEGGDVGAGINHINSKRETPLLLACRNGLSQVATKLLKMNHLVKPKDEFKSGTDKLVVMACMNSLPHVALQLLYRRMGDVNRPDKCGITALIAACKMNMSIVANVILKRLHANVKHIGGAASDTALILACKNKMTSIVSLILRRTKIAVSHVNVNGESALEWCCRNNLEDAALHIICRIDSSDHKRDEKISLLWACRNKMNRVANHLTKFDNTDQNHHDETQSNPLMWAIKHDMKDVVNVLLSRHCNCQTINQSGEDALSLAISRGWEDIAEKILSKIPPLDPIRSIALIGACRYKLLRLASQLMSGTIDYSMRDPSNGSTALCWACQNELTQLAESMLKVPHIESFVNIPTDRGETPLFFVCQNTNFSLAYKLLFIPGINAGAETEMANNGSPLTHACKGGIYMQHIALKLLELPSVLKTINHIDSEGMTALMWACERHTEKVITSLLQFDTIRIDQINNEGNDTLFLLFQNMIFFSDIEGVVMDLIDRPDANLNHVNNEGNTLLLLGCSPYLSSFCAHNITLKLINKAKVNVNKQDSEGNTPLMHAILNNHDCDFVSALLKRPDIDINCENNDKHSALTLSCRVGCYLLDSCPTSNLVALILLDRPNININQITNDNETPLIIACRNNQTEIALKILDFKDVLVNHKDSEGRTALLIACEHGLHVIASKLLSYPGIEFFHTDSRGVNAFMCACMSGNMEDIALRMIE